MFCQQCGAEMMEGAIFCVKCGAKAVQASPPLRMSASASTGNGMQGNVSGNNPYARNSYEKQNQYTNNSTIPNGGYYGDNIKPYYRAEFDKIASGQKTKFNWAAFFLAPYTQLYNGCTKLFCKTFLLTQGAVFITGLISILGTLRLNFMLMSIASMLMGLSFLAQVGLQVLNGINFNQWFYQDVMGNPNKKRNKKGLWIFIVCQIVAIALLNLIPIIFKPSYEDLLGDLSDYDSSYVEDNQMESNKTEMTTETGPRKFAIDGDERRPMFQQFSALLHQSVDFSGMSDEEIQSYLENAYTQWLSGEAYPEIVFDENYELIIQDIDDNEKTIVPTNTDYTAAYVEKVREVAASDDTAQFALIDLTGNDIPELVTEQYYAVSVFMWADGEVKTLMDGWGYGAGGNTGYEYLPGKNVIYNSSSDQGGAIRYEDYMEVGDTYEIVNIYEESLSIRFIDDQGQYIEEPDYYYGNTKISKQEYDTYQISGEYEMITGYLSVGEILAQLGESDMFFETGLSSFSENSLYLFAGRYESGNGTSISVSIYSSFDEGNTVGNIFLYDALNHETFATIRDDNAGEGIYTLCFDDGSVMYIGFYQDSTGTYYADIQGLDAIYTNTNQIETYIMTEHYIS